MKNFNLIEIFLHFIQHTTNLLIFLYVLWLSIAITSSIVVFTKHPIHSILALIAVFIEVGVLLLFLGLEYIAFVFLVVYVGAIAVLFLFVTMMLSIRQLQFNISILAYLPATIFIFMSFFFNLIFLFLAKDLSFFSCAVVRRSGFNVVSLFYTMTQLQVIGHVLYTYFAVPFLASAIVLLVAMIGSISLTLYHKSNIKRQLIDKQLLRDFVMVLKV